MMVSMEIKVYRSKNTLYNDALVHHASYERRISFCFFLHSPDWTDETAELFLHHFIT